MLAKLADEFQARQAMIIAIAADSSTWIRACVQHSGSGLELIKLGRETYMLCCC